MTKLIMFAAAAAIACIPFSPWSNCVPDDPPIAYDGSLISTLQVKDMKASQKWFTEVLGFKEFYSLPEKGWCEMTTSVKDGLLGLSQVGEGKTPATNGSSALGFGVKDMNAAKARLEKHQVKLKGDIYEIPQTVKLLYFFDPDGNTLYFYEPFKGN